MLLPCPAEVAVVLSLCVVMTIISRLQGSFREACCAASGLRTVSTMSIARLCGTVATAADAAEGAYH